MSLEATLSEVYRSAVTTVACSTARGSDVATHIRRGAVY
jgi:hypothetical protein